MKKKLLISACFFLMSGAVFANCPDNFKAEKMAECITVEGSGANYQDWQKNEYRHNLETNADMASMVSPITGTDIRTLKPAAGTSKKQNQGMK